MMASNLSNNRRATSFFFWIAVFALAIGCRHHASMPDGAATANEVSPALIGKQIIVHGQFSLLGKVGPFIVLDNKQVVYLEPNGNTWGPPYSEMEGKRVAAKGVLRFFHMTPSTTGAEQAPPDYFYFEAKTAQVRLDTR